MRRYCAHGLLSLRRATPSVGLAPAFSTALRQERCYPSITRPLQTSHYAPEYTRIQADPWLPSPSLSQTQDHNQSGEISDDQVTAVLQQLKMIHVQHFPLQFTTWEDLKPALCQISSATKFRTARKQLEAVLRIAVRDWFAQATPTTATPPQIFQAIYIGFGSYVAPLCCSVLIVQLVALRYDEGSATRRRPTASVDAQILGLWRHLLQSYSSATEFPVSTSNSSTSLWPDIASDPMTPFLMQGKLRRRDLTRVGRAFPLVHCNFRRPVFNAALLTFSAFATTGHGALYQNTGPLLRFLTVLLSRAWTEHSKLRRIVRSFSFEPHAENSLLTSVHNLASYTLLFRTAVTPSTICDQDISAASATHVSRIEDMFHYKFYPISQSAYPYSQLSGLWHRCLTTFSLLPQYWAMDSCTTGNKFRPSLNLCRKFHFAASRAENPLFQVQIFKYMKDNYEDDISIKDWTLLSQAICKLHDIELTDSLWELTSLSVPHVDMVAHVVRIEQLIRLGKVDEALQLFSNVFGSTGRHSKSASDTHDQSCSDHMRPAQEQLDLQGLHTVLFALFKREPERISHILLWVRSMGIQLDSRLYTLLAWIFVDQRDHRRALDMLDEARGKGLQDGQASWVVRQHCMVKLGRHTPSESAVATISYMKKVERSGKRSAQSHFDYILKLWRTGDIDTSIMWSTLDLARRFKNPAYRQLLTDVLDKLLENEERSKEHIPHMLDFCSLEKMPVLSPLVAQVYNRLLELCAICGDLEHLDQTRKLMRKHSMAITHKSFLAALTTNLEAGRLFNARDVIVQFHEAERLQIFEDSDENVKEPSKSYKQTLKLLIERFMAVHPDALQSQSTDLRNDGYK